MHEVETSDPTVLRRLLGEIIDQRLEHEQTIRRLQREVRKLRNRQQLTLMYLLHACKTPDTSDTSDNDGR